MSCSDSGLRWPMCLTVCLKGTRRRGRELASSSWYKTRENRLYETISSCQDLIRDYLKLCIELYVSKIQGDVARHWPPYRVYARDDNCQNAALPQWQKLIRITTFTYLRKCLWYDLIRRKLEEYSTSGGSTWVHVAQRPEKNTDQAIFEQQKLSQLPKIRIVVY